MRAVTLLLLLGATFVLSGCASKFRTYSGPEVTFLLAYKEDRQLLLLNGNRVLRSYNMDLGFAPTGDKEIEGDGRTPEGLYYIDRKNPDSMFYLSLGISYPNAKDRAQAAALGESPGGDIFIHGTPRNKRGIEDWTWGCLALTNAEMEEIFAMVNVGTPIMIYP